MALAVEEVTENSSSAGPSFDEPPSKRKAEVKRTSFQSELLRIADEEHEAKMKILKLKEEYHRQKFRKL